MPLWVWPAVAAVFTSSSVATLVTPYWGQGSACTWTLILGIMLIAVAVSLGSGRVAESVAKSIGPRPPDAPPAPTVPPLLIRPELQQPQFKPPSPTIPAAPEQRLPGEWTHCNVCHRRLTDPISRWRGIGPDCYRRRGISWPGGPVNPAYSAWQRDVERIRHEFRGVVEEARAEHERQLSILRTQHQIDLQLWFDRADERAELEDQHDRALIVWEHRARRHASAQQAWDSDRRQRMVARGLWLRTYVLVIPGVLLFSAILRGA